MRISIVSPFYGTVRGGIERHAEDLANALRARGHLVTLGTSTAKAQHAEADWVLFEGIDRRTLWRWRERARGSRPRVGVFVHGTFLPVAVPRSYRPVGGPRRPARSLADCSTGPGWRGASARRTASSCSPAPRSGTSSDCSPPSANASRSYRWSSTRGTGRSGTCDQKTGPYVAAVSRVDRRKNFGLIAEALAGTDIGFRLAGHDHGDLGRNPASSPVGRRLRRVRGPVGPVDDAAARTLMRGAVATVLPSFFEGVPVHIYQSLAQGTPALCTDLCYVDPIPGVELAVPSAEAWGRLLQRWERGGRPSVGLPPGRRRGNRCSGGSRRPDPKRPTEGTFI